MASLLHVRSQFIIFSPSQGEIQRGSEIFCLTNSLLSEADSQEEQVKSTTCNFYTFKDHYLKARNG